jgi:hypothetical protein
MIIKNYYQPIKIPITPSPHWEVSEAKDIEREMTEIIIDMLASVGRIDPKIKIIGFRRTRKTNRGISGVGRFHKNWGLFKNPEIKIIEVKVGVKVI